MTPLVVVNHGVHTEERCASMAALEQQLEELELPRGQVFNSASALEGARECLRLGLGVLGVLEELEPTAEETRCLLGGALPVAGVAGDCLALLPKVITSRSP